MINFIIDKIRIELLDPLFNSFRQHIIKIVEKGFIPENIALFDVHAFIRAAKGREQFYVAHLSCQPQNQENYVVHGDPTFLTKALAEHIKTWASNRIRLIGQKCLTTRYESRRPSYISIPDSNKMSFLRS